MKCASAKAGIVMTGLAVVLSAAPAHATFIYLNPSQSIGSAIGANSVAASGRSATTDSKGSPGYEDIVTVAADTKNSDATQMHGEMVYAGLQQPLAVLYGNEGDGSDAANGYDDASYSTPFDLRWSNLRGAARVNSAYPLYRSDSAVPAGSAAVTAASKDSPAGLGGVTAPAAPIVTPPVANIGGPTPPLPSIPQEVVLPPFLSIPSGSSPTVEAPIVGLPSKTVPEPSTVGLLGIGLLLIFVGLARGKRARYYSKVSGSPRSSREMGSLARVLTQDNFNRV